MMKRLSSFALLVFVVTLAPLQATAQQQPAAPAQGYYGPGPWHMWNDGYGWGMGWFGPLMMFFFLVVIFGAIFLLMRGACGLGGHHRWGQLPMMDRYRDPDFSALQILNERFAKGEIQKEEYAEKKAAILSHMQR